MPQRIFMFFGAFFMHIFKVFRKIINIFEPSPIPNHKIAKGIHAIGGIGLTI